MADRFFLAPPILLAMAASAQGGDSGDALAGKAYFSQTCMQCHAADPGEGGGEIGPTLFGLIGRKAGTQPGFDYSAALAASNIVWSAQTLERWIADPNALVPGNKMIVQLASDPADRAAIIEYLVAGSTL